MPPPAADPAPRLPPHVLVIEDDDAIRAEIASTLGAQGFRVSEANNGRAGLWRLWDVRPDLILCDLVMPVMDGLDVLAAIRGRPEWTTIPFVFLTSCDDRASMRRAMETGADDYVTKPLVHRELLDTLRAALDRGGRFARVAAERPDHRHYALTLPLPDELRTPLDVIFGYAEVLMDEARERHDAELDAIALGIRNAARQVNRITENFVLWTQLGALRPAADMRDLLQSPEPVALDLVAGTGARERAAQVGRSADLVCELEPAPAYVRREFLRKITMELVDNAFKFSPAGSTVRVTTGCRSGRTQLVVSDRGTGMPAAPSNERGLGLGLAIVRRVVSLAGGQVNVQTADGGGTTVVVSLPSTRVL